MIARLDCTSFSRSFAWTFGRCSC